VKKHILTLAGAIGSGKSSTAKRVAAELGYRHFSSGDLFRTIAKELGVSHVTVNSRIRSLGIQNVFAARANELAKLKKQNQSKCRVCQGVFPRTKDFFYGSGRNFHAICKTCAKEQDSAKYRRFLSSIESYAEHFVAKRRLLPRWRDGDLTPNDIINQYNKQNGLCFYTGEKLELQADSPKTISVDRIDSSISYTKGNIVLCCHIINTMKTDSSVSDFKYWCAKVSSYLP
jgi:hypothetical protein